MAPKLICGIDEAGRGPLAGPLVAAAVIAPEGLILEAQDSKRLTEKRREAWLEDFMTRSTEAIRYDIIEISVPQINANGIGWANKDIFKQLVERNEADEYIIDGNHKIREMFSDDDPKKERIMSMIRADESVPLVSAASILAKTHRDRIMLALHEKYPQYHWHKNKGYATMQHISALKTFGGTPHHRGQYTETVSHKDYGEKGEKGRPLLLLGPGTSNLAVMLLAQIAKNLL